MRIRRIVLSAATSASSRCRRTRSRRASHAKSASIPIYGSSKSKIGRAGIFWNRTWSSLGPPSFAGGARGRLNTQRASVGRSGLRDFGEDPPHALRRMLPTQVIGADRLLRDRVRIAQDRNQAAGGAHADLAIKRGEL